MEENKWAQVDVGKYKNLPLLGVPRIAGLEECDNCHDDQLRFNPDPDDETRKWAIVAENGKNIYCNKCMME